MENLIIYLAKASLLIALFYVAYQSLLRNETFFYGNRKFLIAGLAASAILPLLVFTRTVWVDPVPVTAVQHLTMDELMQYRQIMAVQPENEPFDWYILGAGVYLAGCVFFMIRFVADILAIRKLLKGQQAIKQGSFKYIDSCKVQSPFSFFNYIVYNSAILSEIELESILNHEKVHSRQAHSLDMVISQLFCIAFWFNPFAWLYKKAVAQNLEFIADAEATRKINDTIAYQKALLKITVQPDCTAITNHFYQSLIKKRIVMLNKKQSKTRNSWKYAVIIPAIAVFMVTFQLEVKAQEKEIDIASLNQHGMQVSLEVTKDSRESELNSEKEFFKKEFNTDINFSNIKRNSKGEITGIKVSVNDGNGEELYEVSGTEPIKPFSVKINKDKDGSQKISFGQDTGFSLAGNHVEYFTDKDSIFLCGNGTVSIPKTAKVAVISPPDAQVPPSFKSIPAPPAPLEHHLLINGKGTFNSQNNAIKIGDDDMLVVINGQKREKGQEINILPNEEITGITILDKKDAKKKYGKDGKKGAMEITTRRTPGHYTTHVLNSQPGTYYYGGNAKTYIGSEQGFELEDMLADIDRMKELSKQLKDNDLALLDQLKAKGLSREEINAVEEQLITAQKELQRISSDDRQAFKLDFEDSRVAREAMEKARATMEAHREELSALREEMRSERGKVREEMEKAREEQQKAIEEERKKIREHRKI